MALNYMQLLFCFQTHLENAAFLSVSEVNVRVEADEQRFFSPFIFPFFFF